MRNPHGYATIVGDLAREDPTIIDGGIRYTEAEIDTYICAHCNAVKHVLPRMDPADMGGLCKQCMQLICPRCVDKGVCAPWEKQVEEREARAESLRSYGL